MTTSPASAPFDVPLRIDRGDGLLGATRILLTLWAASLVIFGTPDVFHDALSSGGVEMGAAVAVLSVFVLSLNVAFVALMMGLVVILRTQRRRVGRAALYALVLPGSAVAAVLVSGSTFGSADNAGTRTSFILPGLATWALALGVFVVSRSLLPEYPRWVRRPRLIRIGVVGAVAFAALFVWLHMTGRPSITLSNDTSGVLQIQLCPAQECTGTPVSVNPGQSRRLRLQRGVSPRLDSVRVTDRTRLVGCLPVLRDPDLPTHQTSPLSEATEDTC